MKIPVPGRIISLCLLKQFIAVTVCSGKMLLYYRDAVFTELRVTGVSIAAIPNGLHALYLRGYINPRSKCNKLLALIRDAA